jgi:phosphatidylinositol alpha-1,6-mannosyltransferase
MPPEKRVLLGLTSVALTGGIASVNRNIVRAFQDFAGSCNLRAVVLHDDQPQLPAPYLTQPRLFHAEGCRSCRARFVLRFARQCWRWRPELVFVDHVQLAAVAYLLRRLVPKGYVLFCHGAEFDFRMSTLRRKAFAGASLRLSNSRFTAQRLMTKFPGIRVDPCELGLEELALPPAPDGPPPALPDASGVTRVLGDQFVLIVGRLSAAERCPGDEGQPPVHGKGYDQLIAVMPKVINQFSRAQLVIAGGGDDLKRLQGLARYYKIGHAVLFTGFAAPTLLTALFAHCRLFAMPGIFEGFGLVYLEAMRFAKPCIASRTDGGREVVVDGVTGLQVGPTDQAELTAAITRLLGDDGLSRRMGSAGRRRLDEYYRYHHFRDRLKDRLADLGLC